jgi:ligand-binding sensor domain-containing protein
VDDGDGTLWVGSGSGILQMRRSEWEHLLTEPAYRPKFRLYDRADGLAGTAIRLQPEPPRDSIR